MFEEQRPKKSVAGYANEGNGAKQRLSNSFFTFVRQVLTSVTASLASNNSVEEALLLDIVAGLQPSGARPSSAETFFPQGQSPDQLQRKPPRRVALCALPETCSRHNSPPQPHAIADCARSMSGSGNVTIVMCLADPSYAFAAGW